MTGWGLECQSPVAYEVAVQHLLLLRKDFRMKTLEQLDKKMIKYNIMKQTLKILRNGG